VFISVFFDILGFMHTRRRQEKRGRRRGRERLRQRERW